MASEKDTCCHCAFLAFLFPSRQKNIVVFPDGDSDAPMTLKEEPVAEAVLVPASRRELTDEALTSLELDNSEVHDNHDAKTDRSDDTVVATHDLETVVEGEEREDEPEVPILLTPMGAGKGTGATSSPLPVAQISPPVSPSGISGSGKKSSILFDLAPIKIELKGNPFDMTSAPVAEEEGEACLIAIAEDPYLLIGWQIEIFDKADATRSLGVRAVNGVKRMRGQPYKHHVVAEVAAISDPPSFRLSTILRSHSSDDDSESSNEKWTALRINEQSNKAGWPFKLLRRVVETE